MKIEQMTERVVKVESIVEQIIAAPVETVVIVKYMFSESGRGVSDALVKTGVDGYRGARNENISSRKHNNSFGGQYLHHEDIQAWHDSYGENAKFYILKGDE